MEIPSFIGTMGYFPGQNVMRQIYNNNKSIPRQGGGYFMTFRHSIPLSLAIPLSSLQFRFFLFHQPFQTSNPRAFSERAWVVHLSSLSSFLSSSPGNSCVLLSLLQGRPSIMTSSFPPFFPSSTSLRSDA